MPRSGGDGTIHEAPVARDREFRMLVDGLRGRGPRVVLIDGEPGIGKSFLLDAAVDVVAAESDVRILRGRSPHGGGAPAYWPWVQALRRLAGDLRLPAPRRDGERTLASLVPDLFDGTPYEHASPVADEHRFELYSTVVETLARAARNEGVAVVLDDLHMADGPTLELLVFAAADAGPSVRFVVAFRGHELGDDAEKAVATLQSLGQRLILGPLDAEQVAVAMQRVAGVPVDPATAETVTGLTNGNPLFVREVTRLLAARGALDATVEPEDLRTLPPEIREVIRQRVAPLGAEPVEILNAAAVIGRDFGFTLLRAVTGKTTNRLLEVLAAARDAGLVDEVRGEVGNYRFSHELVRATIYDDLPAAVRLDTHLRAADALDHLQGSDRVFEHAHHLYEAALIASPERVADACERAGERAMQLLAFAEASRQFERAVQALETAGVLGSDRRADLLIRRGQALRRAGSEDTRACLVDAADAARDVSDAERFTRATLEMQRGIATIGTSPVVDRELVQHLEEALELLPPEDSAARVQVMALLSETGYWDGDLLRWQSLSADAVAMARRLDNDVVLARALMARHFAIWGPDTAPQRIAIADELVNVGERSRDAELVFMGRDVRLTALLELGDIVGARHEVNAVRALYDELRQPVVQWALTRWDAFFALMEGRLDDAEEAMTRTAELGTRLQDPDAVAQYFGIQSFILSQERERLTDLEDAFREEAERHPHLAGYRAGMAYMQAVAGRKQEARIELDRFVERGLDAITRDQTWTAAIGLLCRVAAIVGDAETNRKIHELVAPYTDLCVIVGDGTAYGGSMAQFAALTAWRAGDLETAEDLFEQAMARNLTMGARPFTARAQRDLAEMLTERGAADDVERARRLLRDALELAEACDMEVFAADVRERLDGRVGTPQTRAEGPAREQRARLDRDGDLWRVAYDGVVVHLPAIKGLGYLAALIRMPGREVHVLDLAMPGDDTTHPAGGDDRGSMAPAFSDAGPVIDAEARARYTSRLEELQADLDEAEAQHDTERTALAREEIDALATQLVEGTGLGGRSRPSGSPVERARVSVTKALRSAIGRIEDHLPELGRHLDAAVRTGVFCSYAPDPSSSITWER